MDDQEQKTEKITKLFKIIKIEKADPQGKTTGGEWYLYSIEHESSPIDGMREGTLSAVKKHVEEYVENLNDRATHGYSAYAAKKVKRK